MKMKLRAGEAIPISDRIDFTTKTIVRDNKRCYIMIMGQSPTRGYDICTYLCAHHGSTELYKANINSIEKRWT